MSYIAYLSLKTEGREFKYEIFETIDCFDEVTDYVCGGNNQKYKELEKKNFIIRDFEIKDFYDFLYKVVVEISKKVLKEQSDFYNTTGTCYTDFIPIGKLYQDKTISETLPLYLGWQYCIIHQNIKYNPSLKFYNLIEFLKEKNLINVDTFELKPNMKITLNLTRPIKKGDILE